MVEHLTVLIDCAAEVIQGLLGPHQNTLGEDSAGVLVRILNQLVRALL